MSARTPHGDPRPCLTDFPVEALRERFAADGLAPYRAEQVARWLYARGVVEPRDMTDLPKAFRDELEAGWRTRALEVATLQESVDGTAKALLRAADGALVEAVAIPDDDRTTLCLSTQVGCPLACSFCATGALGFTRNLSTGEIVDQVLRMREALPRERRITNVVFMGMGEPLLNLPNVLRAIRLLLHPGAFGFAPRRVTVSTSGVVPKIRPLVEASPVNLAVSLHASTDAVRDELVPLNRRFPLDALLAALRALPGLGPRRPIFFEYTLIEGLNDAPEDAKRLVRLLAGLPAKVNVIPMNAHADAPYRPPSLAVASRFLGVLSAAGMTCTLRRPRGADIDAACGQLAARPAAPASARNGSRRDGSGRNGTQPEDALPVA